MVDLIYTRGSFEFQDGTFATQYVAYVLGAPSDQGWDFQGGSALIYGLHPQYVFARGYATFNNGAALLSSEPLGAFEDFAMHPEAQPDPLTGFVLADNSGNLTGLGATWSRHYRVVVPPKTARFAVPHIRLGSVSPGVSQYLDAHQFEVIPVGQTLPNPFRHARAVHVAVRPSRLNYYAGSNHVTDLIPGRTYIASATVSGKRTSSILSAGVNGTIDLPFGGTATKILVEEGTTLRGYFDGNSGPDYLWEAGGTGTSRRSYYYPDRAMRHYVLVRNLQKNVALGMTVEDPVYATLPAASSTGGDLSLTLPPPPLPPEPRITSPVVTGTMPVADMVTPIGSAAASAAGTTLTIAAASTIPAGSLLRATIAHTYTTGAPTVTDTGGNVWTRDRTAGSTGLVTRQTIYSTVTTAPIAAGASAFTITTTSTPDRVATISKLNGTPAATSVDSSNGVSNNSATPSVSGTNTTAAATLLVASVSTNGPSTDTFADAAGWTVMHHVGTSGVTVHTAYRTVSGVSALAHSVTLNNSRNWVDFITAYAVDSPAPTGTYSNVIRSIPGLTHYYPLDAAHATTDTITGHDGTNYGVTFSSSGATFNGSSYIEIPDHADFSLASLIAQEMTIVVFQNVTSWAGSYPVDDGSGDYYYHWLSKGGPGAFEWVFRQYTDTSINRRKRTSTYHFNKAGGLGAGSYFQDDDPAGTERFVMGMYDMATTSLPDGSANATYPGSTTIWRDHVKRDQDGFWGGVNNYNIVPQNTSSPVRLGTRGDGSGYFVGNLRRLAFFNRKLTQAEVDWLYAARNLPE